MYAKLDEEATYISLLQPQYVNIFFENGIFNSFLCDFFLRDL